ncbi:MAG: MarR family transcriptional regulator [Pseudomonadota bacterium]
MPSQTASRQRNDTPVGTPDPILGEAIELLFFAYRDFTGDPDAVLATRGLGRAHHRAIHFIRRQPGITVAGLLDILQVTKQSLNRVLRQLIEEGLVVSTVGERDRRERNLRVTAAGDALAAELTELQRARLGRAFDTAGPDAVEGFRKVMQQIINSEDRSRVLALIGSLGT